ncbi:putative toxin biosynthesis protein [Phaeoacremonium minimum UCRPA7]|uniref:Putative toxin biosynthesis protein n=1 Tax=Phaeoacremonium minimum (strain UCR-PA7) TaxID=1286976 RepID=R8BU93_PHAM7|nr:putative toxin biosynthesis protein [Phaeoacremonium minimum UCRPA7]EOO02963.1 putative toxin biosynthesis protein [Phaeoacremonium minimum UCRPA7]
MPSTETNNTVYVITGANRGIGLGLVAALLARPRTTVVGTARSDAALASLAAAAADLPRGEGSVMHGMLLDLAAGLHPDEIRARFPPAVAHVDVLICSAAHCAPMATALETSAAEMRASYEVNTIAPLLVFQALWPLMKKAAAPPGPKFVAVSSSVGIIGNPEPLPGGSYGPSKAALNWLAVALHAQHAADGLVSVALHPGFVKTAMGHAAAADWATPGVEPGVTVEESAAGILSVVDGATRETLSGKFVTQRGQILPW